jgi:dienelactone hydrolase
MRKFLPLFTLALFALSSLQAAVKTEMVQYKQGDAVLEGYLAYDDAVQGKRPGILIVHEWWGLNGYAKKRAEQLAALGYVAFAADIYGKGLLTSDFKQAAEWSGKYKNDRKLFRARTQAGLDVLRKDAHVDAKRIAAIGYCFGGTAVLEMARGGQDVDGVVSFHGGLNAPIPANRIKAKVLVLHGADDPYVPEAEVKGFQDEMKAAQADWQMIFYSGAVHGFSNPGNGGDNSKGMAYNADADRRSWKAMLTFFDELFKR